ncbi:hypothetical protein BpHYR1_028093 [Brachionus plicatilis]|uniref:Uncharacterized protein n=1 Tax=Brachionus plicatilis TaxID=10195 RepID=A0A3M7S0F5_BRAPC|nr:hypothetical protein BpHYR1_028093 [Brachionus plicatilis]
MKNSDLRNNSGPKSLVLSRAFAGGAVQVFNITPGVLDELDSNEAQPLDIYWADNSEHLVNEDIQREKQIALN